MPAGGHHVAAVTLLAEGDKSIIRPDVTAQIETQMIDKVTRRTTEYA